MPTQYISKTDSLATQTDTNRFPQMIPTNGINVDSLATQSDPYVLTLVYSGPVVQIWSVDVFGVPGRKLVPANLGSPQ
jgi:hypothetical protein